MHKTTRLRELSPLERFDALERGAADEQTELLRRMSPLASIALGEEDVANGLDGSSLLAESLIDIVTALHAVDRSVQDVLGYFGHAYLLGDDTVRVLLRNPDRDSEAVGELESLTEALATLGVLYRFNVARKFGYPSRRVMQLRLNGWGRAVAEARHSERTRVFLHAESFCREAFRAHRAEYTELLELCNSGERPLDTRRIHQINDLVSVPLVS